MVVAWTDQLCINWHNEAEVDEQVKLIPEIFEHKFDVIIWLGEAAVDSLLAIEFIPDLLDFGHINLLVRRGGSFNDDNHLKKLQALIDLMKRDYFSCR